MTPEMPENAMDAEQGPQPLSEISRLTGVFFEPVRTFTDIAERPRWFVPLALVILASLAFTIAIGQRLGWERVIDQQMQAQMAHMSDQQRAAMEQSKGLQVKIASVGAYVMSVIGAPLYCLIAAGVLLLIVNGMMSAGIKFKQAFAVICYSGLPGILLMVLMIVAIYMKPNPDDFNMQNPLPFNLGWFMSPDTPAKFLRSIATSIDIFSFWAMALIATGLKAAGGRKLAFGGALTAVLAPWAIVVLVKAALAR
jgi:hypothetical protein